MPEEKSAVKTLAGLIIAGCVGKVVSDIIDRIAPPVVSVPARIIRWIGIAAIGLFADDIAYDKTIKTIEWTADMVEEVKRKLAETGEPVSVDELNSAKAE